MAITLFTAMSLRESGFIAYLDNDSKCSEAAVLATILVAAFAHDMGRRYENHQRFSALLVLAQDLCPKHCKRVTQTTKEMEAVTKMVASCIDNHSGARRVNTLEESVVILADGLHCDHSRVQSTLTPAHVLRNDPKPIEYFSCLDIVSIDARNKEHPYWVEIAFNIRGLAAFRQIESFRARLRNTIFGSEPNGEKISVLVLPKEHFLERWCGKGLRVWPRVEEL